ncbi:putative reverse transcriptase zinc-binding domain-containing protein [Helianthus annuus]|nr:putative reverse transcriptase zinc-binding domain-containing protein [Helianthus annuus]
MQFPPHYNFFWNAWVSNKVAFVAWRAVLQRLLTVDALIRRNVSVQNSVCRLCSEASESVDHIFISCHFSQTVWQVVSQWYRIPLIVPSQVMDILDLHTHLGLLPSWGKKALHGVILTVFLEHLANPE